MKLSHWAYLAINVGVSCACPFANSGGEMPKDHPEIDGTDSRRRLGLRSLRGNPAGQERVASTVRERVERSLQNGGGCFTTLTYDEIMEDISAIFEKLSTVVTDRDRGHFFGGIVRLAAHDFMDYDKNHAMPLGPDGCIDWNTGAGETGADNAGLETIWCDVRELCPLKDLYDSKYATNGIGRADFWVAAANAVIKLSSLEWTDTARVNTYPNLDLPFRYGRVDLDNCDNISAIRLPGAQGCGQVEKTFINQMGLTWTDAVALLGAHVLGYGHSQFSGHDGMWVDEEPETIIFNKRYYEEILRRAWRLRDPEDTEPILDLTPHLNAAKQDWTWAGTNRGNPRFMLNADICLAFDIEAGGNCCTRIRDSDNADEPGEAFCVDPRLNLTPEEIVDLDGTIHECPSSENVRPEARQAVDTFAVSTRNGDAGVNGPFYEAFSAAWQRATEAGYSDDQLHDLADTCDPTDPTSESPSLSQSAVPSVSPSASPSARLTESPSLSQSAMPSVSPSASPSARLTESPSLSQSAVPSVSPSASPSARLTESPSLLQSAMPSVSPSASPSARLGGECRDLTGTFVDNRGKDRECSWVLTETRDKCREFAYLCPVTCDQCQCLLTNHVCETDDDCCSAQCIGEVGNKKCECRGKNQLCTHSDQCCSGECRSDGTCSGNRNRHRTHQHTTAAAEM